MCYKKHSIIIFFALIFIFPEQLVAQVYMNRDWVQSTGVPSDIDWSASIKGNDNIIVVGNTITTSEQINILVTKYDQSGQIVWETEYNNPISNDNDYGTAVTLDANGNVYVAGASYVPAQESYDFVVLKYSSSGTLLWNYTYNNTYNGNDVPTAIIVDASGNTYVTGGSEGASTQGDYCTLKINPNGSMVWEQRYDYNNLMEVSAGIDFDNWGNIVVTGGSGKNTTTWEYATLRYSQVGNLVSETRVEVVGAGIDQPSGITKDLNGNFYITGSTTIDGINYDIKTVKLDTDMNLVWTNIYDGDGFEDRANSIMVDGSGQVYLAGYSTQSNGETDFLTVKINTDGTLNWNKTISSLHENGSAKAQKIALDGNGNIYVLGQIIENGQFDLLTVTYNFDGKLRWKFIDDPLVAHEDIGLGIYTDALGDVFVLGKSKNIISSQAEYVHLKYSSYKRNQSIMLIGNQPDRFENELIVKFQTDAVNIAAVDNRFKTFGEVSDFITPEAVEVLKSRLGMTNFGRLRAYKVFPRLTTAESTSITRATNRTIPVPSFLATFGIILPTGTNDTLIINELNSNQEHIEFATYNHIGIAHDTNDPEFLNGNQAGLVPTQAIPNANINIEQAWNIAESNVQSTIKVGVYDTGINWQHEDFGDGTFLNSKITDGYDYYDGTVLSSTTPEDEDGHGTAMAGIIGAIRNNEKGGAGVAGGDNLEESTGVQLFDMRILGPEGNLPPVGPYSIISNAIVEGALDSPGGMGYALDVMNHSWGGTRNQMLKDANRFAFENEVAFVGSSGNGEVEPPNCNVTSYPVGFNDSWNAMVGANDETGLRAEFSGCAKGLDFIAPGVNELITTTGIESSDHYVSSGGTSSAAAHVSGVIGLMLSYVNNNPDRPNNLAPEDCENLIQRACTNVSDPQVPYEQPTGYGRVNAGEALDKVQLPKYKAIHFNVSAPASTATFEGECEYTRVNWYQEVFDDLQDPMSVGSHRVDRYKVTVTDNFDIGNNVLVDAWVRNSASNLYGLQSTEEWPPNGLFFLNETDIEIENITNSSITLSGYLYHFYVFTSGQPGQCDELTDIWYPLNLDEVAEFAYTLYLDDPSIIITSTDELEAHASMINIFPNPSSSNVTISVQTNTSESVYIDVFDAKGCVVKHLDADVSTTSFDIETSTLSSGIYYVRVKTDTFVSTEKLVIQH